MIRLPDFALALYNATAAKVVNKIRVHTVQYRGYYEASQSSSCVESNEK